MALIVLQERPLAANLIREAGQTLRHGAAQLCALVLMLGTAFAQAQTGMPTQAQRLQTIVPLSAGMHVIKAEVAQTPREHMIGLMWRTSMGPNEGMIFVFPQDGKQCFWMKNTLIPLSVAFIDATGRIVNLDEMQAQSEDNHCSNGPVRYVLEMNKGWFTKKGIKAGDKISGPMFPTAH